MITAFLPGMSDKAFPPSDLDAVDIFQSTAHIVSTIPLEPAARVRPVDPALAPPHRQRLAAFDTEVVQVCVGDSAGLGIPEPVRWKLIGAIIDVAPLKHTHLKHLQGRLGGREVIGKIAADGLRNCVAIAALHLVVNDNFSLIGHVSALLYARVIPKLLADADWDDLYSVT